MVLLLNNLYLFLDGFRTNHILGYPSRVFVKRVVIA